MENWTEKRLTERGLQDGDYILKSKNDVMVLPYKTYDLFFEITFRVLPKLGMYEDIGTPEECRKAMEAWKNEN